MGRGSFKVTVMNTINQFHIAAILEVIAEIRKSDCGAWLKECHPSTLEYYTCADGREKRQELSRLLDKLYEVSDVKGSQNGN